MKNKGKEFAPQDSSDRRVWELPNGRFIYRTDDGGFEAQPPNDNYWVECALLEDAVNVGLGEA